MSEPTDLLREAYRLLADPAFRSLLVPFGDEGSRPIITASDSDSFSGVVARLDGMGGSGNVIIRDGDKITVLTVQRRGSVLPDAS